MGLLQIEIRESKLGVLNVLTSGLAYHFLAWSVQKTRDKQGTKGSVQKERAMVHGFFLHSSDQEHLQNKIKMNTYEKSTKKSDIGSLSPG